MAGRDLSILTKEDHTADRLGLIAARGPAGVFANVRHVVFHSPYRIDFGRDVPGSADLALSTLCALIMPPTTASEQVVNSLENDRYHIAHADDRLWSVTTPMGDRISRLAWRLHRSFKTTFVLTMKDDCAYVPLDIMRSWIDVQSRALVDRNLRGNG